MPMPIKQSRHPVDLLEQEDDNDRLEELSDSGQESNGV